MIRIVVAISALTALTIGAVFLMMNLDDGAGAGRELVLQAPDDYCRVYGMYYEADEEILADMREEIASDGQTVLAMYADCEELSHVRSNGGGLSGLFHVAIYTEQAWPDGVPKELWHTSLLATFGEEGPGLLPFKDTFDPSGTASYIDDATTLLSKDGVSLLESTERTVFYGLSNQIGSTENSPWVAVIGATTIIDDRIISLILIDIDPSKPAVQPILERQRLNIERLIAAND